jgi:LmbE family N-acetylglucosaminyl deacetylase
MKVLVIAPHADDEVLGAGGTLHKHVNQHDDVSVVIVSDRKGLKNKQRNESKQVRDALKYNNIFHLGLQDEYLTPKSVIDPLEKVYNEIKPDLVYTCNKEELNLDHQAVYDASTIVCRSHQEHAPKMVLLYEILSQTFTPNYYSVLSWFYIMRKQVLMSMYTDEVRQAPHPRSSHGIETLAKKRGIECGSEYAEGFKLNYYAHDSILLR